MQPASACHSTAYGVSGDCKGAPPTCEVAFCIRLGEPRPRSRDMRDSGGEAWGERSEMGPISLAMEEPPELQEVRAARGLPCRAMMRGPLSADVLPSSARLCAMRRSHAGQ